MKSNIHTRRSKISGALHSSSSSLPLDQIHCGGVTVSYNRQTDKTRQELMLFNNIRGKCEMGVIKLIINWGATTSSTGLLLWMSPGKFMDWFKMSSYFNLALANDFIFSRYSTDQLLGGLLASYLPRRMLLWCSYLINYAVTTDLANGDKQASEAVGSRYSTTVTDYDKSLKSLNRDLTVSTLSLTCCCDCRSFLSPTGHSLITS